MTNIGVWYYFIKGKWGQNDLNSCSRPVRNTRGLNFDETFFLTSKDGILIIILLSSFF